MLPVYQLAQSAEVQSGFELTALGSWLQLTGLLFVPAVLGYPERPAVHHDQRVLPAFEYSQVPLVHPLPA